MSNSESVTIIGAGPVGSLMSIFLARRGFEVTIFERRPDMRTVDLPAGRSINLALANRGINALDRLGLMDEVGELLIPMRGRMIHGLDGALNLQPYGNKPNEVIYSVSRAALNTTLLNAAEAQNVTIRFNQRCDDVDFAHKILKLLTRPNSKINPLASTGSLAPMVVGRSSGPPFRTGTKAPSMKNGLVTVTRN